MLNMREDIILWMHELTVEQVGTLPPGTKSFTDIPIDTEKLKLDEHIRDLIRQEYGVDNDSEEKEDYETSYTFKCIEWSAKYYNKLRNCYEEKDTYPAIESLYIYFVINLSS